MLESRNAPMGIEKRTTINLEFIKEVYDDPHRKQRVHLVTQTVNSLLGLVVLPYEKRHALHGDKKEMEKLYDEGWPRWTIILSVPNEPKTLGKLMWHLRNAASHGRYSFSSDSRDPSEVTITVHDKPKGKPINWRAAIRADELYRFCLCLSKYIEEKEPSAGNAV